MLEAIQVSDDYLPLYHNYTKYSYLPKHKDDLEFDWNVIINVTYNVFIIRPIS